MQNSIETSPLSFSDIPAASPNADLLAECKQWENRCAEAIAERDRLRAELAKAQQERDQYKKSLLYYVAKDAEPLTFTREEVFTAVESEPSLGELIAEVKKEYALEK